MKGVPATNQGYLRRGILALAGPDRILGHNLLVAAGTMAAGLFGVAFQSLASHQLRPEEYGAVFSVVTLIASIGLPASACTLLMARETSRSRATGHIASGAVLLRRGNQALLAFGSGLGVVIAISAPLSSQFLAIPSSLLLAAAVGLPFGIALPLLLGELQGQERFTEFAGLSAGQALAKLVAALAFGRLFGPTGFIMGISLATVVSYGAGVALVRRKLRMRARLSWLKPAAQYLLILIPSTLALASLLSCDVLLVKHYFSASDAGNYAVIAAIGRAIFWGASGIAIVLFPKATFTRAQGGSGIGVVTTSLVLVAAAGGSGLLVLSVFAGPIVKAFAGTAYVQSASYLSWYALGMLLLGAAAVLIASHQSRGRPEFLAVLLPLTALEPLLIASFHNGMLQAIQVMDISMALVATGLGAWWLAIEMRDLRKIALYTKAVPAAVSLAESQVD